MADPMPIALILGAAVRADGTPSPALRRRTETGIALWREGRVVRLILSGAAMGGPVTEAACMASLCRAAGLPESALTLEEQATSTWENLFFAKALLAGHPAIIVTDSFHAPRARIAAWAHGVPARLACPPHPRLPLRKLGWVWSREAVACAIYLHRWLRARLSAPRSP